LWDNSIFIVSNDHGTLMPSFTTPTGYGWDRSPQEDVRAARAASRMLLLWSGGLAQAAKQGVGLEFDQVDKTLRSQVDVFATLADVFSLDKAKTVGDSLFARERRFPVVVDLGERVFVPSLDAANGAVFKREDWLRPEKGTFGKESAFFLAVQHLHTNGMSGK
jgi:hypothetical protein